MKKSLLALAALTAFAGVASAQSSVTLFGVVDLNVRNVEYGNTSQSQLSQDGIASSRLGFRGVEDLGGGLRAGFWIEGSISPDTGGTTQTWSRRSTVSLMGGFGEVRLGRDYTPTFWGFATYDPFGTNGVGAATNLVLETAGLTPGGSYGTLVRASNTVGYFLPAGMGGLYGQAMVAAGENTNGNKYYGGRIGYAAGPLNVSAAYGNTELSGQTGVEGTTYNFGGSFNMGFATVSGAYNNIEVGTLNQDNWYVGISAPMGQWTFKASYGDVDRSGVPAAIAATVASGTATQYAFGATYDLSKRTALYGTYSTIDNKGTRFRAGQLAAGGAAGADPYATVGRDATAYEVGIRHSF